MAKGGRPFLMDAVRYACGKIDRAKTEKALSAAKKAEDAPAPPSPKVRSARDLWNAKCFKGGGQGNNAGDPIGQLWLLGKLDMPDMDDARLLLTARDWWHARSVVWKRLGHKTARFARASRSSDETAKGRFDELSAYDAQRRIAAEAGPPTKEEKAYRRYSSFLLDAADYDVDCLEDVMETTLDGDVMSWVSRVIQTELLRFVRLPLYELACDVDYAKWEAARRALRALAGAGALRKDAA